MLLLVVACGSSVEPTLEPTLEVAEAEPVVVVETVVIVATATLETAVDSSADETAVSQDAPVMEMVAVEAGSPTMTTLVALNVRTGPGTQYAVVGALPAGATAEITGKSASGYWWKIVCPAGTGSQCWASAGAQYTTAENTAGVAVASAPPAPTHAAPATEIASAHTPTYTPSPTVDPHATATATTDPNATATTDAHATATATPTATTEGAPTATYTMTPPSDATATYTPTPTADTTQIAPFDNDSLQNPATSVFLRVTGTRHFTHSNDVSYEGGDQDDWVEFEFPNDSNSSQRVWLTLNCTIVGDPEAQLRATVYEDGANTNKIAICNNGQAQLTVDNTKTQQVRIHFGITKPDIYATYDLTVVGFN